MANVVEVLVNHSDEVVNRAMNVVAASRALRERQAQQRKQIYEKIQVESLRRPSIPRGIQLRLNLQYGGPGRRVFEPVPARRVRAPLTRLLSATRTNKEQLYLWISGRGAPAAAAFQS